jgi:hypothetical protein
MEKRPSKINMTNSTGSVERVVAMPVAPLVENQTKRATARITTVNATLAV